MAVSPDPLFRDAQVVPPLLLLVFTGRAYGFESPTGDNMDDEIEWAGDNAIHLTAPALRGIKNATLQGSTLDVGRDGVKVRVINGVDQQANTAQKGAVFW